LLCREKLCFFLAFSFILLPSACRSRVLGLSLKFRVPFFPQIPDAPKTCFSPHPSISPTILFLLFDFRVLSRFCFCYVPSPPPSLALGHWDPSLHHLEDFFFFPHPILSPHTNPSPPTKDPQRFNSRNLSFSIEFDLAASKRHHLERPQPSFYIYENPVFTSSTTVAQMRM